MKKTAPKFKTNIKDKEVFDWIVDEFWCALVCEISDAERNKSGIDGKCGWSLDRSAWDEIKIKSIYEFNDAFKPLYGVKFQWLEDQDSFWVRDDEGAGMFIPFTVDGSLNDFIGGKDVKPEPMYTCEHCGQYGCGRGYCCEGRNNEIG